MSHLLRRGTLAVLLALCWSTPYVLPFRAAHAVVATGVGHIVPAATTLGKAAPPLEAGWLVAFALSLSSLGMLIVVLSDELPRLQRQFSKNPAVPWLGMAAAGALLWLVDRLVWPDVCVACVRLNTEAPEVKVQHSLLLQSGTALLVPPFVAAVTSLAGNPLDASKFRLRRWFVAIAGVLFVTPPYLVLAKAGQFTLLALGAVALGLGELPALEQRSRLGKWRFRACVMAFGLALSLPARPLVARGLEKHGAAALPLLNAYAAVLAISGALTFVVVCLSTADGLAWALRGARSLRTRLLVFGLCCAALAFLVNRVRIPVHVMGEGAALAAVMSLLAKLVGAAVVVFSFSLVLSRELVQKLERTSHAIVEISQGNLAVELPETGRDELAEVARSVNRMLAELREASFLERINAELRARSEALASALEKLANTQVELVRSERMASVAVLVKGIAHELNNPINYIAGNVAPLRRYSAFLARAALELADGRARGAEELRALTELAPGKDLAYVVEDLDRLTEDLGEGARRAALIIGDLQSLTAPARREIELVDVERAARRTVALLLPRVPHAVHVEVLASELPPFPARAGELEQVLLNLIDNALRAVGEHGTVRVRGRAIEGTLEISVEDDGPGLTDAVKSRVFEPFFTTRSAGEGSGLGLAIVSSIVRAHGGTVAVESEPGTGARFVVRLPWPADGTGLEAGFAAQTAPLAAASE
jgi:signal transduction histidine kinase